MNNKLFQYAILFHPTEKEAKDEGLKSKVIIDLKTVLATEEIKVAMEAAMEIPAEYKSKIDQIQIVVRAF